jgi:cytochrome c oxidase subunit 4
MESAQRENVLYRTAAALLALLALTVGFSFVDLGPSNFSVALAIAAVKALLVAYYFMELGEGVDAVRFMAAAGFVWLGLLLAGALADLVTRS